jgi:hypothetical protein
MCEVPLRMASGEPSQILLEMEGHDQHDAGTGPGTRRGSRASWVSRGRRRFLRPMGKGADARSVRLRRFTGTSNVIWRHRLQQKHGPQEEVPR